MLSYERFTMKNFPLIKFSPRLFSVHFVNRNLNAWLNIKKFETINYETLHVRRYTFKD